MSDTQKLLPCPFCNGTDIRHNDNGHNEWVECFECRATGPYSANDEEAGVSIDEAWNRRSTPPGDKTLKLVEAVLHEACRVVDADTYKHPTLSRADAVAAGVAGLHDAVRAWLSAQPPSATPCSSTSVT